MAVLALGGLQLPLQIGDRARLGSSRSGPRDIRCQLSPRIKEVGIDTQFLPNHRSGLAALEPVQDRLAFEGFVEFPVFSDRCLFHALYPSLFTRFSVRQFEVPSEAMAGRLFASVKNS